MKMQEHPFKGGPARINCKKCGLSRRWHKEEVTLTKPDGQIASLEETQNFLNQIQRGVFYLPQNR